MENISSPQFNQTKNKAKLLKAPKVFTNFEKEKDFIKKRRNTYLDSKSFTTDINQPAGEEEKIDMSKEKSEKKESGQIILQQTEVSDFNAYNTSVLNYYVFKQPTPISSQKQ